MAEMDLSNFSMEELLLAAAKSEIESRDIYSRAGDRVSNYFLKDRFRFLAAEEEKHLQFVEAAYRRQFPGKDIVLPARTPVPLPAGIPYEGDTAIADVIAAAMNAETAARDFYRGLARRYAEGDKIRQLLEYVAAMEQGHYDLLAPELERAREFEDYATSWPMVHEGP